MKPWKLQKFIEDVVYDLRSRGLLPVAMLLVAGLVAVPLAVSQMGGDAASGPSVAGQTGVEPPPEAQEAVLAYDPGVRNYRDRLQGLESKNPFRQQFTAPDVSATALESSAGSGGGAGASASSSGGSNTGSGGSSGRAVVRRYYHYETDVAFGSGEGELRPRRNLEPFQYLPSANVPLLVFLGNYVSGGLAAAFMVSDDVTGVEGGKCAPSPDRCEIVAINEGKTARLTTDGSTYRIKVTRIELVSRSKPPGQ